MLTWPLTSRTAGDGAALTPNPRSHRCQLSAPAFAHYSVLVRDTAGQMLDLHVVWSTRRNWDRQQDDGRGTYLVLPIGRFFVIALRLAV